MVTPGVCSIPNGEACGNEGCKEDVHSIRQVQDPDNSLLGSESLNEIALPFENLRFIYEIKKEMNKDGN